MAMAGKFHFPFWLIALALLTSATAFAAEDCSEVRLDAPGGTMEHVPVRDQGNLGDCYAVAEAELVDAYRKSHGGSIAFNSSAIDGTVQLGLHSKVGLIDSLGYTDAGSDDVCDIVRDQKKTGLCDEKVVEENPSTLAQDLDFLNQSYDILTDPKSNRKGVQKFLKKESCGEDDVESASLATTQAELMAVLKSITRPVEAQFLRELSGICSRAIRRPLGNVSCEKNRGDYIPLSEHEKTKAFLLSMLRNAKSQPIAIGYCGNLLYKGQNYEGLDSTADRSENPERDDCDGHDSLIIGKGRDPKTGRCSFLIQNSWGTDCSQYSGDWVCEKKTGKIWVDADVLSRNIDQYHYLK